MKGDEEGPFAGVAKASPESQGRSSAAEIQVASSGGVPAADASELEIIRFAQAINGYEEVGGEAADLGRFVAALEQRDVADLSLRELRILLFARQRAHYHQGGGWPGWDPLMDEMRELVAVIRERAERPS